VAVRVGVFLSGLASVLLLVWTAYAFLVGPEWFVVILIYAALYWGAALAVIWLGVFVFRVIAMAFRVLDEPKQL